VFATFVTWHISVIYPGEQVYSMCKWHDYKYYFKLKILLIAIPGVFAKHHGMTQ